MNNDNLQFLQDSLKYLGFGTKLHLNDLLEERIEKEPKEFQLETEAFFEEDYKLEAILYFRRGNQGEMYFFNKYTASLIPAHDPENSRTQTFYISKGTGVTFKEAYNLLQGRSVNKDLINAEGQKYNAWIQLNFEEKDLHDNYKVKQYRVQYGYDLEKTLQKYPIAEMKQEELRAGLIRSLKKGNQHTVSFEKTNKTEKMLIEANPQYKTINIYSLATRAIHAGNGPEGGEEEKPGITKSGARHPKDGDGGENGLAMESKEEEPEKTVSRKPAKKGAA